METLAQIPQGKKAIIRSIKGGVRLAQKLQALGIREGKEIEKVSAGVVRGPVVLRCGKTEVAIGFGMAQKILIETV